MHGKFVICHRVSGLSEGSAKSFFTKPETFFFADSVESAQFIKLKTSLVNRTPISVCCSIYCMAADEMQRWIREKSSKTKSMQGWSVFVYLFGSKMPENTKERST